MPRRKKLDMTAVVESLLAEFEFRTARAIKEAILPVERRLERLEKRLGIKAGKGTAPNPFKECRQVGCVGRVVAQGLCSRHYQQLRYQQRKAEGRVRQPPRGRLSRRGGGSPRPDNP